MTTGHPPDTHTAPSSVWLTVFMLVFIWVGVQAAVAIRDFSLPDESAHYLRAYEVSRLHLLNTPGNAGIDLPCEEYKQVATANGPMYGYIDVDLMLADPARAGACVVSSASTAGAYSPLLYVFSGLGFGVADLAGADFRKRHDYGRMANAIGNTLIIFCGLALLGGLRPLFAAIALMPMNIWLRSSLSADAITFSFCFFYACLLARYIEGGRLLRLRDAWYLAMAALLVGASKPLYSLLPFASLVLLSRRPERLSRPLWCLYLLLPGVVSVLLAFVLTSVADPSLVVKVFGADPVEQVKYVLSHPFATTGLMVMTVVQNVNPWLDHLTGSFLPDSNAELYLLPLALLAMTTHSKLEPWQRLFLLFAALALCAETMMALYVTYTPVGRNVIDGVQARQFLPVLVLLMWPLAFSRPALIYLADSVKSLVAYVVPLLFVVYYMNTGMQFLGL